MNFLIQGHLGPREDSFGRLLHLVVARVPQHRTGQGILDVSGLARELDFSNQTVHRSFKDKRLSERVAQHLIRLCHETVEARPILREELFDDTLSAESVFHGRDAEAVKSQINCRKWDSQISHIYTRFSELCVPP